MHTCTAYKRLLRLTTIYLLLTLVGNARQMNLPRGNFHELQMADLAVRKPKPAITLEIKLFGEICQLKPL